MSLLRSLVTPRLCLRGWRSEDVGELSATVARDLSHLRPWLPWAEREPVDHATRLQWLSQVSLAFEVGAELYFGIWSREDGSLLGGHGLHRTEVGGPFETGYWVVSTRLREGIAREATVAVTRYAMQVRGLRELLIRIRPGNTASAGVAESIGYAGPFQSVTSNTDRCGARQAVLVYSMTASRYAGRSWSHSPATWIDRRGREHVL